MIKALAGDTLMFFITEENVTRLRQGKPILIDLSQMGNPKFTKLVIDLSKDMEEAQKKIAPYIGPDTREYGKEN